MKWMSELKLIIKSKWTLNLNSTLSLNLLPVILVHRSKYLSDLFYETLKEKNPLCEFFTYFLYAFNIFSSLDMFTLKSIERNLKNSWFLKI